MGSAINILKEFNFNEFDSQLDVAYTKEQHVPGSLQYSLTRLHGAKPCQAEDAGMMVYHFKEKDSDENFLELRYCIFTNRYCTEKNCRQCDEMTSGICSSHLQVIDLFIFRFTHSFLSRFTANVKLADYKDDVLAFRHPHSFTKLFPVCSRKKNVLDALFNHNYTGSLENIFTNAKIHELLLYSMECLVGEKEEVFTCKFLSNELDREKIMNAREVLLQHIGEPITIKELSRKVAINECYLKKGFKEIFGTTIFEFYQQQRMEHAKYLLYEKGLSVTDVSFLLGYSSISHFSTAFKKHTGLKPCELLYANA